MPWCSPRGGNSKEKREQAASTKDPPTSVDMLGLPTQTVVAGGDVEDRCQLPGLLGVV